MLETEIQTGKKGVFKQETEDRCITDEISLCFRSSVAFTLQDRLGIPFTILPFNPYSS